MLSGLCLFVRKFRVHELRSSKEQFLFLLQSIFLEVIFADVAFLLQLLDYFFKFDVFIFQSLDFELQLFLIVKIKLQLVIEFLDPPFFLLE